MNQKGIEVMLRQSLSDVTLDVSTAAIVSRAHRMKRRKQLLIAGPVIAALVVGAGGYALLTAEDAPHSSVLCFDQAVVPSDDAAVGATSADNQRGGPVASCTQLWASGLVKEGSTTPPPMTACLNPQYAGAAWVFPGKSEGFCADLGLQALPAGFEAENRRFLAMKEEMISDVREAAIREAGNPSQACLSEATAERVVRNALVEHGFDEWRVVTSDAREPGECAQNLTFDDVEKTVTIDPTNPGELPTNK